MQHRDGGQGTHHSCDKLMSKHLKDIVPSGGLSSSGRLAWRLGKAGDGTYRLTGLVRSALARKNSGGGEGYGAGGGGRLSASTAFFKAAIATSSWLSSGSRVVIAWSMRPGFMNAPTTGLTAWSA